METRRTLHWPSVLAAVGLVLIGLTIGVLLRPGPATAQAERGTDKAVITLEKRFPALALPTGSVALVESRGTYFLIGTNGTATPVRFDLTALREQPSSALLPVP
ncbi:MAG: hypothetical protein IBJ11_01950 [Phycisphaerales bacterium]|nr:hypothetical protein [Phycisphaerales bacterium]